MPRDPVSETIENNTVEYFLSLGYAAHDEVCDTPGVKYILNDYGHSRIFKADFGNGEVDAGISGVLARLKERSVPALWFVTPSSRPESIESRLKGHGFSLQKEWRSMAMGLESLPPFGMPPGLSIKEAQDATGLKTWSAILVKSYGIDGRISKAYGQYFIDAGTEDRLKRSSYIGYMNGDPVAIASLFKGKEAAGIYFVGTLHPYRWNGIGTAMVGHLLGEARGSGYGIATLNASPQGYPLYGKMGFKEYYRTKIYGWL